MFTSSWNSHRGIKHVAALLLVMCCFARMDPVTSQDDDARDDCNNPDLGLPDVGSCEPARLGQITTLRAIGADTSARTWSMRSAMAHVDDEIGGFLEQYDNCRGKLTRIFNNFMDTRLKDTQIRMLAKWGQSLSYLLDALPAAETTHKEGIYLRLLDMGTILSTSNKTMKSHVENTVMRGWPMFRNPNNNYESYEGFNFGNIAYAIAAAAKEAGRRGQHELARHILQPVLEGMYDNILSTDPETTKVDRKGRLVRVHPRASKGRFKRFKELGEEKYCLDVPEQYNHGTIVARAAMQVHAALDAIDYQGGWRITTPNGREISQRKYQKLLWKNVFRNAKWMRSAFRLAPGGTGANAKDRYPGESGTDWYIWKYRDLRKCKIYRGTFKDRPQDNSHGSNEMDFISDFLQWSRGSPRGGNLAKLQRVFNGEDVHKLIVTFLNRVVSSYDGDDVPGRFSCDILGSLDGDDNAFAWKSCGGKCGSNKSSRPGYAARWATLTYAARYFIENGGSKALKCDVYRMVKTLLQIALKGTKDFYEDTFDGLSERWTTELLVAKYYFYNYDYGMEEACGSSKLPAAHSGQLQSSGTYTQDVFSEWLDLSYGDNSAPDEEEEEYYDDYEDDDEDDDDEQEEDDDEEEEL